MEPIFADIKEARRQLGGCGHTKIYELIKQNELEKVKLGSKTLITTESIRRYANKLLEEAA